jgi:undecaprenyl-diphosphatase
VIGALAGALQQSRTYVQQECAELLVEVLGPPVALATDGEVVAEGSRFEFFIQPAALKVYRPDPDSSALRWH